MAQASGAQREPSMEEILASIRRIIEDSDNGKKPAELPPIEAEAPLGAADVETFRAELGPAADAGNRRPANAPPPVAVVPPATPGAAVQAEAKSFRLAEVQAQIAREAAQPERKPVTLSDVQRDLGRDPAASIRPAAQAPQPAWATEPQPAPQVVRHLETQPRQAAPTVRPAEPQPAPPVVRHSEAQPPSAAPAARHEIPPVEAPPARTEVKPVPVPVTVEPAAERRIPEVPRLEIPAQPAVSEWKQEERAAKPVAAPVAEAGPKPVMISAQASRQIAASFNELSEAFAQRSKRTFDDMAEQMLRPMLQEWLDNNLPLLVERLVREEIERVARGD